MLIEEELSRFTPSQDTVLTVGVFDGVHRGHQHLLGEVVRWARENSWQSGVVTFRRHPRRLLSPDLDLPSLSQLEEREWLLREQGISLLVTLSFTPELAHLRAREFVLLLHKYLKMRALVVGPNFALGRNREGNATSLTALGRELNFAVRVVPPLVFDGEVVSSTAIRNALAAGDMERARKFLGRPFCLVGPVLRGEERGRLLGFPTANLGFAPDQALPADGVYATRVRLRGKRYLSVTNIGHRPTFGGKERTVEVYLLDFQGNLYGESLTLEFFSRLRDERTFASAEELVAQIQKDVAQVRSLLK